MHSSVASGYCHCRCSLVSSSAARSAITTHGAIVLAVVILGMMEPSATRKFSTPQTSRRPSTTDVDSLPILADLVPAG